MGGIEVRYKVWLVKDGKPILGKGGAELLKAIEEKGSLHAAAEALGYSYSFAWSYLKKLEERAGVTLIERRRGGQRHGGMVLTEEARKLLKLYLEAERVVDEALSRIQAD